MAEADSDRPWAWRPVGLYEKYIRSTERCQYLLSTDCWQEPVLLVYVADLEINPQTARSRRASGSYQDSKLTKSPVKRKTDEQSKENKSPKKERKPEYKETKTSTLRKAAIDKQRKLVDQIFEVQKRFDKPKGLKRNMRKAKSPNKESVQSGNGEECFLLSPDHFIAIEGLCSVCDTVHLLKEQLTPRDCNVQCFWCGSEFSLTTGQCTTKDKKQELFPVAKQGDVLYIYHPDTLTTTRLMDVWDDEVRVLTIFGDPKAHTSPSVFEVCGSLDSRSKDFDDEDI